MYMNLKIKKFILKNKKIVAMVLILLLLLHSSGLIRKTYTIIEGGKFDKLREDHIKNMEKALKGVKDSAKAIEEKQKEQGITEIDDMPIEKYMDSLIQEIKEEAEPVPKKYEIHGDLAEIIEEMELDSSEANVDVKDVRGLAIELNGDICFGVGSALLKPELKDFLDAAVDSFLSVLVKYLKSGVTNNCGCCSVIS